MALEAFSFQQSAFSKNKELSNHNKKVDYLKVHNLRDLSIKLTAES